MNPGEPNPTHRHLDPSALAAMLPRQWAQDAARALSALQDALTPPDPASPDLSDTGIPNSAVPTDAASTDAAADSVAPDSAASDPAASDPAAEHSVGPDGASSAREAVAGCPVCVGVGLLCDHGPVLLERMSDLAAVLARTLRESAPSAAKSSSATGASTGAAGTGGAADGPARGSRSAQADDPGDPGERWPSDGRGRPAARRPPAPPTTVRIEVTD